MLSILSLLPLEPDVFRLNFLHNAFLKLLNFSSHDYYCRLRVWIHMPTLRNQEISSVEERRDKKYEWADEVIYMYMSVHDLCR